MTGEQRQQALQAIANDQAGLAEQYRDEIEANVLLMVSVGGYTEEIARAIAIYQVVYPPGIIQRLASLQDSQQMTGLMTGVQSPGVA